MLIDQLPEISDANDSDEMPIEQGTTTRKIKILNLLKGVVSKDGDTITGGLTILSYLAVQRSSGNGIVIDDLADDSTVNPGSARNGASLAFRDKNGIAFGVIRARHVTSSYKGLYLYGNNSSAPSGSQTNGLYLMVNDSGEKLVTLSDPAAWRSALELCYAANDTYSSGTTIIGGVVTNSAKRLLFIATVDKSLENIRTVTVTDLHGHTAGVAGVIYGNTSASVDLKNKSGYTVTATKINNNTVRIQIDKSTAFTNASTATPFTIYGYFTLKFT